MTTPLRTSRVQLMPDSPAEKWDELAEALEVLAARVRENRPHLASLESELAGETVADLCRVTARRLSIEVQWGG